MQSLERTTEKDFPNDATKEKEIAEYVVLQRMLWKGKEDKWRIWGTVEENTEDVSGDDISVAAPAAGKR